MTSDDPHEALTRVQADLADLSARLADLAEDVRRVSTTLPPPPGYRPPPLSHAPPATYPPATQPLATYGPPATYGPLPPPPTYEQQQPRYEPPPTYGQPESATPRTPPPAAAAPARPARPRRPITVAEVFAILGAAITLIGVAFVLVLPADGVLGPSGRVAVAAVLAVAAIGSAIWQHARDARNLGAQALMATGIASAYLCVLALTVIFDRPDGRPLLPAAVGLVLAGLISVGGLWLARRWASQWLAVLAVLGSLVLAPFVVWPDLLSGIVFMIVLTVATAPFQLGRTWLALMAARLAPTSIVFTLAALDRDPSITDHALVALLLAAGLAFAGLGMAVLHQRDARPQQIAAAVGLIVTATPVAAVCWLTDRAWSVLLCALLGGLYAACGLLPRWFSPVVRSAAVPVGALLLSFALLRLTDESYPASILFGVAAAHLVLAARTRFRPLLVVGLALAGCATLVWIPALTAPLAPYLASQDGLEPAVDSLLGLGSALLAAMALRAFGVQASWLTYAVWIASVIFGSVAVVVVGAVLGDRLGAETTGFQTAHAVVTVTWLVLSVLLLWLGLQRSDDGRVAVRLAIGLAGAAVLKLFVFDLSTLPGLVRALAFLAVGVLLLVIGTWYFRQLERVRRPPAPVGQPVPPGWVPPPPEQGPRQGG